MPTFLYVLCPSLREIRGFEPSYIMNVKQFPGVFIKEMIFGSVITDTELY
jgi:hypothetical protein